MGTIRRLLSKALRAWVSGRSRARLPRTSGELKAPGLSAPAEVLRDRWGVPHIYAAGVRDAAFTLGFVHAQDRLWQMEMDRRLACGRLSELFGDAGVETDVLTRTLGFRRLAELDLKGTSQENREHLVAYAAGVNAWVTHAEARLPVEFFLLRHHFEPWTALDSLAYARLMGWMMSHAWASELTRARLVEAVGPELAAELEPRYPESLPIVLPQGIEFRRLDDGALRAARGPWLNRGRGSNAWAVAGSRTTTGKPFLCNDIHLQLAVPSLWYEAHLEAAPLRVAGGTIAGLPFVLAGHNERIAWGLTLAFTDAEDLFVEELDPSGRRARFGDGWDDVAVVREEIAIKGKSARAIDVRVTRHGPIVLENGGRPLALASMALRPGDPLEGWRRLNLATGWDDFVDAMSFIEAPQLSVAYADVDGNIGQWVSGTVPVRAQGQGLVPAPGQGTHEWAGEVPFEEMPHALNPESGLVVTCNHRLVPDSYPHFLGSSWMSGWRAQRVNDLLRAKSPLGPDDFAAIQRDVRSLPAQEIWKRLSAHAPAHDDERLILDLLRGWDFRLTPDSAAAAAYEAVRASLVRTLLEPALPAALIEEVLGRGPHRLLCPSNEFLVHDTNLILRMMGGACAAPTRADDGSAESAWVTRAGGRAAWISRSFRAAAALLRSTLGPNPRTWSWGRLHAAVFIHPLGVRPPLDAVFNLDPVPIGGDGDTPCQTMWSPEAPFQAKSWCPSLRLILDAGDWGKSVAMHAPGQSGHLGSAHYDDLLPMWAKGEYHAMPWREADVRAAAVERMNLVHELK